jgi:peptidyl-prolyl cis-trans isomerase D
MLQAIRSQVGSWIVKILFFFLILSFAVWGIGDIFRDQGPAQTVAEVGDRTVDVARLDTVFRGEVQRLQQVLGPEFNAQTAVQIGVVDQALEEAIRQELFAGAAADMALTPPTDRVAEEVRRQPVFQDEVTGQFDRQRFLAILNANGLTEAGYVQILGRDMARQLLSDTVTGAAAAPAPLVDALYRYRAEERVGTTIRFEAGDIDDVPEPATEDLVAFHGTNPEPFTAPEYRELTVVPLTAEELAAEIAIDEDTLRDEYEARLGFFQQSEQRSFDQVVLDDRETAQAVAEAADAGQSLAEAVETVGVEAPVIPLELGTRDDLPFDALADAGFALELAGVSEPVETPFGWHVLKLTGAEDGGTAPFEDVRGEIEAELALDRARDAVFEMANRLEDELAGGATLEQAAQATGLDIVDTPPVARDGSVPEGATLPEFPAQDQVLETAFATPAGEASTLQETQAGDFFIVRVDGVVPPELRPFEQVRDRVAEAWRADRRDRIAAERAAQAIERMGLGGAPAEVAEALDGTLGETPPVTRDAGGGEVPAGVVSALFALDRGGVDVVDAEGAHIAVRLAEIRAAEPAAGGEEAQALADQLVQGIGRDMLDQFARALRARQGVTIDQGALDRYIQQIQG